MEYTSLNEHTAMKNYMTILSISYCISCWVTFIVYTYAVYMYMYMCACKCCIFYVSLLL